MSLHTMQQTGVHTHTWTPNSHVGEKGHSDRRSHSHQHKLTQRANKTLAHTQRDSRRGETARTNTHIVEMSRRAFVKCDLFFFSVYLYLSLSLYVCVRVYILGDGTLPQECIHSFRGVLPTATRHTPFGEVATCPKCLDSHESPFSHP